MDPELIFLVNNLIIPLAAMGTAIILGVKVLGVVRHYIDRKVGRGDAGPAAEIADLKARLESLQHTGERLDEIEDRLDFAERMLTRGRGTENLGKGT